MADVKRPFPSHPSSRYKAPSKLALAGGELLKRGGVFGRLSAPIQSNRLLIKGENDQ